jgi:hypothetical protein
LIRLVITFVDTSSTDKSQIKKNQVIPSKIIVYSEHQKEKKNNTKKTKTKTKKQRQRTLRFLPVIVVRYLLTYIILLITQAIVI